MEQGDYVLEVQRHEVARQSLLLRQNKSQSKRTGFYFVLKRCNLNLSDGSPAREGALRARLNGDEASKSE